MSQDLRGRIEHIYEQVEDLGREIRTLNREGQQTCLLKMQDVASSIEQAIRDIDHSEASPRSAATPNDSNRPFDTWFRAEIQGGADYGSVADAAAAYEAAGYKFI